MLVPRFENRSTLVDMMEVVSTLGPGVCFGELSLLENKPRSATIVAVKDTLLIVLSKIDYDNILLSSSKESRATKLSFIKSVPVFFDWSKR